VNENRIERDILVNGVISSVLSLVAILLIVWVGWPQTKVVKVTGHKWRRVIYTEELQTVRESRSYIPEGARNSVRHTRQRTTGGGPRSHPVTVEEVYWRYDIERWRTHQYYDAQGDRQTKPAWPVVVLAEGKPPYNVGAQRESGRSEWYTLLLAEGFEHNVSQAQWEKLEPGSPVVISYYRWGTVRKIQTPED